MMQNTRQLRRIFVAVLMLFIGGMLASTAYTLWRLRADAIASGLELAAMHAHSFEELLTQNLRAVELVAANILEHDAPDAEAQHIEAGLATTLRRSPFLRSMSLVDEHGVIIASSNPANVGMVVSVNAYLPMATNTLDTLRIGQPWDGRDFSGGRPTSAAAPADANAPGFIPVAQTLTVGNKATTLLVALNPDYFINYISGKLVAGEGSVDVLRYDGTLLMSTNRSERPGARHGYVERDLRLAEVESGRFEQGLGGDQALSAFRASRLYPLVAIARVSREHALRNWVTEAKTLLGTVIPALLAISLLAILFYRRQFQLVERHAELERLQRINATVFDSSTVAILITDLDTRIISINASFTRVTGYSADDVIGRHLFELLTPDGIATCEEKLPQQPAHETHGAQADATTAIEVQQHCKDGRQLWMEILSTPERDAHGAIVGYHRICRNVTERKQAEEKLLLAASVFTHANEGILIAAADGTIIDVNDAFCRITGYSRDEALGRSPRILKSGQQGKAFYAAMWSELAATGHWHGEIWNRRKDGEMLAELLTISAVRDAQGNTQRYVALFSDITPLKEHERELERIAHFDALTNLPNRVLLADRLHQAMSQEQRRGQHLAVAFLDLDGFKTVNDHYGHEAGDQLLITVANRMKQALREGDTLARLGGDEFVAVLLDLQDLASSLPTLTRLLDAAAQPVSFGDHVLQVSASLGVTFYPQAEEMEADQLLRQADQAMYQAKMAGKNRYYVFTGEPEGDVLTGQAERQNAAGANY